MIRGTEAFGVCDFNGAALYFDQVVGSWDSNSILLGPAGVGANFGAFKWFGTGKFTRIFDAQTFWVVGLNFQPRYNSSSQPQVWAQDCFLRLDNAGGTVMCLELQTSGKIAVTYGGDGTTGTGTTLGTTTQTFPVGAWSGYVELKASGFGGAVAWEMWLNDTKILSGTAPTLPIPDRVTITSQDGTSGGHNSQPGFGIAFANVLMLDGTGPAPYNDRIGPVRITAISPTADASGNWNNTVNGAGVSPPIYTSITDLFGVDAHGSPDGDYSFISPVLLNTGQYFSFGPSPCFGLVLGVNVCQVFRGATGSTTCNAMLIDGSTAYNLGGNVVNGGYHTCQVFVGFSPATGTNFTDAEISGNLWGALTTSPGLMLTQMFLEKITSLRDVPYNCGGGSYSF